MRAPDAPADVAVSLVPRRAAFVACSAGALLVSLDVSIANAVLRDLGADLGQPTPVALSWVISLYAIVFAAILVPAGRLADRAGRYHVFLWGLAAFAGGSVICGLAPTLTVMLLGRAVQAVGAAAAQPASLGLLLEATTPERRSIDSARWAGFGALGIGSGPAIGGILTALASWRWAFLVNVPIVALVLLSGPRVLPRSARHPGRRLPDPIGALLLVAGAGALILGISEATTWGPLSARTVVAVASGLALGGAFVARCASVEDPVIDVELLLTPRLAVLTAVTVNYSAAFFGLLFSFVLFLTSAWHLSLVETGLAIAPMTGTVFWLSTRVGRISDAVGFRLPLAAGSALIACGLGSAILVGTGSTFHLGWVIAVLLCGLGIGLCYPLLGAAAVAGLPLSELAAASALNQCARQLGAALGVAGAVAALGSSGSATTSEFHLAWVVCAGFAILALVLAAVLPSAPGRRSEPSAARR